MKDYSYIEQDRERVALEREMSSVLSQLMKRSRGADYALVNEVLEDLRDLIGKLQAAMSSPNKEKLLGGEFNKDAIFVGADINKDKTSIPLYFELDIIIATIEKEYVRKFSDPKDIIGTLEALNALREQAATLPFISAFRPSEPVSEEAMDEIIAAKGNFEVGKYEKNGIKFVGIEPVLVQDDFHYSHGDYISDGTSYTSLGKKPLYAKEADMIRAIQKENLETLHNVVGKYFKPGWDFLPTSKKFYDQLLDIDLDERLKQRLRAICYIKDKHPDNYEVASIATPILEEIVAIEHEIEATKQAALAHQKAIDGARARYQEKSGFWKFFHRQMNPERLNLDAMSTEEIDDLYKGKAR